MQKKMWIVIALLLVAPLMFLNVSCQQQVVKPDNGDGDGQGGQGDGQMTPEQMAEKEAADKFVNEDVYFDFDSSSLDAAAQGVLREKAEYMKKRPGVSVTIEGHCDERGTNEYNLALGERRAGSTKAFLVDLGIDASRMSTTSYGEERPMAMGHDEAAWSKNRRAHFVLR